MPSPLIVSSVTVTGTGVTLQTYRRRLADELGFWQATSVSTLASNGEAARVILADELRDDEMEHQFLGSPWLYVQNGAQAGVQRRIVSQPGVGYVGQHGALMLSRPFDAAIASGTVVEVSSPLPMVRHMGIKGLRDCVNEALARIWVKARITAVGNGTYSYDLAAYPWLTDPDQLNRIEDSFFYGTSIPVTRSPFDYRIVVNGVDRTLVLTTIYESTATFVLDVFVRADRLVYDGSSWSFVTTPGLQNDTYQAAPPEDMVCAFGMVKALQTVRRVLLANRTMDKQERAEHLGENGRRIMTYARLSARIKREQMPKPDSVPMKPLVQVGGAISWP